MNKKNLPIYIFFLLLIVVIVIFFIVTSTRKQNIVNIPPSDDIEKKPTITEAPIQKTSYDDSYSSYSENTITATPIKHISKSVVENTTKTYSYEKQSRGDIYFADFTNLSQLPEDLVIENLNLTDNGFELSPTQKEERKIRTGFLISSPIKMDYPCNEIKSAWIEKIPEGTDILLELSLSADGNKWSEWQPIKLYTGDDYPMEEIGANDEFTFGADFGRGRVLWLFFKYKITFTSENDSTPVFSKIKFLFRDTTHGSGEMGSVDNLYLYGK